MAMRPDYDITGFVIYDSRLFNRSGAVGRWATSVSAKFTTNARAYAPVNKRTRKSHWDTAYPPGSLKASISGGASRVGPRHWQIILSIDVPYATHVIYGTKGPITATSSPYMKLPPNPGFGTKSAHKIVRGQRANPFLRRAARKTGRSHSSVRGLEYLFEQW